MIDDKRMGARIAQQRILLNIQNRYHRVQVTVEPGARISEPVRDGGLAAIQLRIVNRRCR